MIKRTVSVIMPSITRTFVAAIALIGIASAGAETEADSAMRFAPGAVSRLGEVTLSPAFTPDGKTAYFSRAACPRVWQCPQLLYKSEQIDGVWRDATRVADLGKYRVDWPSVSPDGNTLVFTWTTPQEKYKGLDISENFDLFTLDLADANARPVAIEGADINRPRAEVLKNRRAFHVQSAGTLTRNGDLYFWDERADAVGERDVFLARSDGNGGFMKAEPLPAPINSTERDQLGWINPAGTVMLLAYPDRGGEGDDDIFISRNRDGVWSEPQNLGPLVNSSAYDAGARFTPDGEQLVFTSSRAFDDEPEGLLQVWTIPTRPLIEVGVLTPDDIAVN